MSLEDLKTMTDAVKARTGINVAELKASDLFRSDLDRETKQALRLDLLRRQSEA